MSAESPVSTSRRTWTADEVRALGVRVDLVTACSIVYGCGRNRSWELFHSGQLDFPALKVGRRVVVPVAPILELLGIAEPAKSPEANRTSAQPPRITSALRLASAG